MSAVEDLLIAHLRDVREQVAIANEKADALEALIERLKKRLTAPIASPTNRKHLNGWSAEEDAVLRENYALLGSPGCQKLLPHRTEMAIRVRASRRLKIRREIHPSTRIWCSQCESRVSAQTALRCQSAFCKAKAEAA